MMVRCARVLPRGFRMFYSPSETPSAFPYQPCETMSGAPQNLFNKVWDLHAVRTLPSGPTQLFIGLHLIHEVTSPQAFSMLRDRGLTVMYPERTMATVDHIIPTLNQSRPFLDDLAEEMMQAIEKNCAQFGITLLDLKDNRQGVVHIVGPEQGLTQPGMTIACGDSHTSTHGAFGAIASASEPARSRIFSRPRPWPSADQSPPHRSHRENWPLASMPRMSSSTSFASSVFRERRLRLRIRRRSLRSHDDGRIA